MTETVMADFFPANSHGIAWCNACVGTDFYNCVLQVGYSDSRSFAALLLLQHMLKLEQTTLLADPLHGSMNCFNSNADVSSVAYNESQEAHSVKNAG